MGVNPHPSKSPPPLKLLRAAYLRMIFVATLIVDICISKLDNIIPRIDNVFVFTHTQTTHKFT